MSEADGRVRIDYEITGIDEASTAQQELEAVLADVGVVLDRVSQKTDEYADATAAAADASDTLTAAAVDSGFKLAEMRERVSSAVGALGTLSGMLGTDSDAGAVIGRLNHFSQLGTQVGGVFGPEGAVVGGIAGATVGALASLYDALEPVLPAIEGVGAAALVAAADIDRMGASAQGAENRMREFVDSMSLTNQARGLADINAQITETSDRIASLRDNGSAFDRLEIPQLTARLSELMQRSGEAAAEIEAGTGTRRRGGGGGNRERAVDARAEERFLSDFRVGLMDEEEARELARIERTAEAERRMLDERKAHDEENARALDEFQRESLANRVREESEALEVQESKRLAIKRRQEADTRMWRGTQESMLDATLGGANAIGGAFANAFGAAIQGQEDFGAAFVKGMKMQLIQFGVGQVAEGAGALLSAVGLAFTNPPAAAGKAVEGAGKIALGVSLGAAGAAISTPAAPSAEDKAPRMGPAANEGASGGNVIVNMNSPFVTAGTQAELGRGLTRSIGMSQRRFGRAA